MKRILIVDDDVVIRIAFKKLLGDGDFIIQQAKDVKEAINMLSNNIYNLVLLDLRLPPTGIDAGFDILAKKRKIPLNASTPVLIVSGQTADRTLLENKVDLEDNVVDILIKPIENEDLLKAIRNALAL